MNELLTKHRANIISELEKIIENAKKSMKEGAWVHVEHHWRDPDEREGVDIHRFTDIPKEKIHIGATIKIMWDTKR